jgi:hypothetical protein
VNSVGARQVGHIRPVIHEEVCSPGASDFRETGSRFQHFPRRGILGAILEHPHTDTDQLSSDFLYRPANQPSV